MTHFAAAAIVLAVAVLLVLALRVYCRLFGWRP
jgi:hypothetical protein